MPVLFIFGAILWLKVQAIHFVREQRSLDRCVFTVLENRCQILTTLSSLNQKLEALQLELFLLQKSQIDKVPIVGWGIRTSEAVLYFLIQEKILKQNIWLAREKINSARTLQCGVPLNGGLPLSFSRPENFFATQTNTQAPLAWDQTAVGSEISILRIKDHQYRSYGHCMVNGVGAGQLKGESYRVVFTEEMSPLNAFSLSHWR